MLRPLRPSRDQSLLHHAWVNSERSTCNRLNVGAVFAKEGRILSMGYNGAPAGLPHCNHECNCNGSDANNLHYDVCQSMRPCLTAEHAERNAIAFAARHGVALEGSELFVTHMPCLPCSMSVVNSGVIRVIYSNEYRIRDGIELLRQANVVVDQLTLQVVG